VHVIVPGPILLLVTVLSPCSYFCSCSVPVPVAVPATDPPSVLVAATVPVVVPVFPALPDLFVTGL
jgi:hypothetical protein